MAHNSLPNVHSDIDDPAYLDIFNTFILHSAYLSDSTDDSDDMDVDPPGPVIVEAHQPPPASASDALTSGPITFTLAQDQPPSPPLSAPSLTDIFDAIEKDTYICFARGKSAHSVIHRSSEHLYPQIWGFPIFPSTGNASSSTPSTISFPRRRSTFHESTVDRYLHGPLLSQDNGAKK